MKVIIPYSEDQVTLLKAGDYIDGRFEYIILQHYLVCRLPATFYAGSRRPGDVFKNRIFSAVLVP